MARYDDGWPAYVPVAERRRKAAREAERLRKKGHPVAPVRIEGRAIATTVWGKAWCDNLESYRDYESRLPRGRTYVRNGSVIDLQIGPREVRALVSGSSIYKVTIGIAPVPAAQWRSICTGLRGPDRLPGGAAARPAVQRHHGAHLPPGHRPVSQALRHQVLLQLPGLCLDVQARCGCAVRGGGTARPESGASCSACARSMSMSCWPVSTAPCPQRSPLGNASSRARMSLPCSALTWPDQTAGTAALATAWRIVRPIVRRPRPLPCRSRRRDGVAPYLRRSSPRQPRLSRGQRLPEQQALRLPRQRQRLGQLLRRPRLDRHLFRASSVTLPWHPDPRRRPLPPSAPPEHRPEDTLPRW